MSPTIFNMIIDGLLNRLLKDIEARIGEMVVNAAVLADDMLLFASTPMGLQKLIDLTTDFLGKCGLKVNTAKCMTISLRNVPHEKKIDRETVFINN